LVARRRQNGEMTLNKNHTADSVFLSVQVRVFSGHRGSVLSLSFSPDGKRLAAAGEDRRVRVWDLASASVVRDLRGHAGPVTALAWSSDSSMLTSAGTDGCVRHWDLDGPPREASLEAAGNASPEMCGCLHSGCSSLMDLRYSAQNTLVAVGADSALVAPSASTLNAQSDKKSRKSEPV